jgi:WD40 repeat protein
MDNSQYQFKSETSNNLGASFIPDVAFHPSGDFFAICYRDNNQVRIYKTEGQQLIRTIQNPDARLSYPHGLFITDNHIIVSNKLASYSTEPSRLTVYRIDSDSNEPVCNFQTPVEHLREAHSIAMHNGLLYITYCGTNIGAILTYRFNDETGQISGPINITEDCFYKYGEPKGICINKDGTKAYVTIAVERPKVVQLSVRRMLKKLITRTRSKQAHHYFNGILIFNVHKNGSLSKKPIKKIELQKSRLENISIVDDTCVIADPLNDKVSIYQLNRKAPFESPLQIIHQHLSFPHDTCLSPDKKTLIITNYGIEVIDGIPQWTVFRQPREDKFSTFSLEN